MLSPLSVHLTTKYLAYFAGLATVSCALAAPFLLYNVKDAYVGLLLLAFVATFALCAVVFELGFRHEFEALQSFGVSLRRFATPLSVAGVCLQVLASVFAVLLANGSPSSLFYAIVSLTSVVVAFAIIIASVWRKRDAGVARACALGCLAQVAFVAVAVALGTTLG